MTRNKPKRVVHGGRTYVRQPNGDYRSDDGSILNAVVLIALLSDNGESSHNSSSDHDSGGGDSGGDGGGGDGD